MGKLTERTVAREKACDPINHNQTSSGKPGALHTSPSVTSSYTHHNSSPHQTVKSKDGPKKFEFVLVTDAESRRQVRRYAMRRYVHQRRLDGIARLESNKTRVRGWSTAGTSRNPSPPVEEEDTGCLSDSKSGSSSDSTANSIDFGESSPWAEEVSLETGTSLLDSSWSPGEDPQAGPSAGVMDPFNSFPMALKRADHDLIPHFITRYPLMMYKIGHVHQYNPIRAIFHQVAIHDPVPFQAMLAVAAKHMAGAQGKVDTVQSLTHKMRALRLLNERLKEDPLGKQDGTIYSAASMAVIEKWSKDINVENMHIRGLTQLLRKRGGMRILRVASSTGQFMEKVLYWVDFSCAPNAIIGAALPWTGELPDVPPDFPFLARRSLSKPVNSFVDQEILQSCQDFFAFLRSLNYLQKSILASLPVETVKPGDAEAPSNQLLARKPSLLSLITTLQDYDHGIRDIRYIDEYCSMACLLYLNVALYDHYRHSQNFNDYMLWFKREIRGFDPHGVPSIASVLWIFLNNGGFPAGQPSDSGERNWLVSMLLRVAKRFKHTSSGLLWNYLRSALLGFLSIHEQCGIGFEYVGEAELSARIRWRNYTPAILLEEATLRRIIAEQLHATFSVTEAVSIHPTVVPVE